MSSKPPLYCQICNASPTPGRDANDRQAMEKQHPNEAGDVGVCLFSEGGEMEVPETEGMALEDMQAHLKQPGKKDH